ncbi:MAG: hypothetical protein JSS09_04915 [Verrucomicrobia bacterium]|nr:hypothetical protein [Verrucomicrobiota bacterium]
MRFFFFLIVAVFHLSSLSSFTVADRLQEAQKGDYIVTEQDKNYSLLLIREKNETCIVFEEVSIPCHKIHLPGMDWPDWISLGAPGHSSWIQYEIDPHTLKLIECYSCSKKGWLYVEESEHFFSKLLSLSLTKVPTEEKKKIGPAPAFGEPDQRPFWTPTIFSNDKKIKIPCESWKAFWPKDDTLLSSCRITLHFPPKEQSFFPIWIEANNGHFNYSIRGIHFGKNLTSPIKHLVPKRPIQILKTSQKTETQKILTIKAPSYYEKFTLFVFDVMAPSKRLGPIPFSLVSGELKETYDLQILSCDLTTFLIKNHRYKWILRAEGKANSSAESEDLFLWNP